MTEPLPGLIHYKATERCDKCRSAAVTTSYCDKRWNQFSFLSVPASCHQMAGLLDHLHVTCANCGRLMLRVPADVSDEALTEAAVTERHAAFQREVERHAAFRREVELRRKKREEERPSRTVVVPVDPPRRRLFFRS